MSKAGLIKREFFADHYQPNFGTPWVPRLTRAELNQMTPEAVAKYVQLRKEREQMALDTPVGCGWTLPMWELVMENWRKYPIIILLGGNRSSKSSLASRLCVWAAAEIPEAEVRAYHVSEERSIEDQQRFVWDAIPASLKNISTKKGQYHSLQYSQKNGFTDSICIFPPHKGYRRGGTIKFGNYKQYQQDAQIVEGFKAQVLWADEEIPAKMFETLIYRTADYHGRLIVSFTTLHGWTPLIQDILGRTRTLKKKFAPLLNMEVPIMQESLSRPGAVIYYFHTEDNAFIDTQDFVAKLKGRPKEEVLARAYGIPSKSISGAFPGFNKEVNVVPHAELPFIKNPEYPVTRYMAIDPAGSKNWFMAWVAVDANGTWWVYREWPTEEWALPGNNAEGKPGPGQRGSKKGIKDYVELIRNAEGDEVIYERYIDPRLGAAERQAQEGATTIISDLDDNDMVTIPAPGVDIDNGLQLINNLLAWDDTKPRDSINAPRLYVSDQCQNIIFALQEYTGKGGGNEATKDPADILRYLAVSNIDFVENVKPDFGKTGVY